MLSSLPKDQFIVSWNSTEFKFHSFIKNFLKISKNMHAERIKIPPTDYFQIKSTQTNHKKRFELLKKYFEEFMPELLRLTNFVCIPIKEIFEMKSAKVLNDYIYITGAINKGIVCCTPEDQPPYKSNQFYFSQKEFVITPPSKMIIGLDFDSMYPSMMIYLFRDKPHLHPYLICLQALLHEKRTTNKPKHKDVYKLIINKTYGNFGIKSARSQNWVCSSTAIAQLIANSSREITIKAKKFFEKYFEVVYCNTDSVVVIAKPKRLERRLAKWNKGNPNFLLKVEFTSKRMMIVNKNVRIIDDKCYGWKFNSLIYPKIVRDLLRSSCLEALREAKTCRQFKHIIELVKTQKYDGERINFEELVKVNRDRDFDLYPSIILQNQLDGNLQEMLLDEYFLLCKLKRGENKMSVDKNILHVYLNEVSAYCDELIRMLPD